MTSEPKPIKERPIIFSGAMPRAILDGRKTQTRRLVKHKSAFDMARDSVMKGHAELHIPEKARPYASWWDMVRCPYGVPGDRLWVKETWCHRHDDSGSVYNAERNLDSSCVYFLADGEYVRAVDGDGFTRWNKDGTEASPWRSPLFMPRWASRFTLEIVSVRVERLQRISGADVTAEGIETLGEAMWGPRWWVGAPEKAIADARALYADLWRSLHGKDAWDLDHYVWVIDFRRVA